MKEVQGDLNTTLIVAVSVGVLMTFFFYTLWPMLHHNFQSQSNCSKAKCDCSKETRASNDGYCLCNTKDKDGRVIEFKCVYKG